jgi:hypothetical protein
MLQSRGMNETAFENHNIRLKNTCRASIDTGEPLRETLQDQSRPRDAELKIRLVGTDEARGHASWDRALQAVSWLHEKNAAYVRAGCCYRPQQTSGSGRTQERGVRRTDVITRVQRYVGW